MKYNDRNKPLQCFMTQSTCYKGTTKMAVKGVLWHSTGANNPTLKRYVQPDDNAPNRDELIALIGKNTYGNDWNHIYRKAGLNCWIGKLADGTVTTIQTMPWDYKPWGCGSGNKGSCNNGWIQFEICEDGLTDPVYFKKVYDEACEITAYLCKIFGIDPNGTVVVNGVNVPTILCHADSHKLGFGSNHGDVNHWFPKHGKSMATARADVAALLGTVNKPPVAVTPTNKTMLYRVRKTWSDSKSQLGAYNVLANAKKKADENPGYKVFDENGNLVYAGKAATFTSYLVKVTASTLNIRKQPTTASAVTGTIRDKGVYTIVEEASGAGAKRWGKLKSGAGWISLDYTKRV